MGFKSHEFNQMDSCLLLPVAAVTSIHFRLFFATGIEVSMTEVEPKLIPAGMFLMLMAVFIRIVIDDMVFLRRMRGVELQPWLRRFLGKLEFSGKFLLYVVMMPNFLPVLSFTILVQIAFGAIL